MTLEVPEGWKTKTLGDLLSFEYGKSLTDKNRVSGEYPVYGSNGIVGTHNEFLVSGPGIIIGRKGTVGSVEVSLKNFWPIDTTYFVNQKTSDDFVWLVSLLKHVNLASLNESTGVPGLNRNYAYKYEVTVPSLPEQKKIAEVLSSVDEAIAATKAVIDQTKQVKKGLLQTLLTKGIGHTKFKQAELGEIPESWDVVKFDEITDRITYGFTNPMPTTDDGPWMVTAANVRDGRIDYLTCRKTSESDFERILTDKSRPTIGTVLLTKDGTLGRVAIVDKDNVCINQSIASLTPSEFVTSKFLYHLLQSPQMQKTLIGDAGGTSVKHIYITKLAKTLLPVPPKAEQLALTSRLDAVDHAGEMQIDKLQQLQTLKSGLMSDLLTGRKRVATRDD